jgi:hypothetical protein
MNLFLEAGSFLVWLARLTGVFLRARPLITMTLVGASAVNLVTSILSFLLPLKIIAMVAKASVSGASERWFDLGGYTLIGGLTAAAILSLILSVATDALANRMAAKGGSAVLGNANQLAVGGNDYATAQAIYAQYGEVCAGALFVLVGMLAIAFVEPLLAVVVAAVFLLQFSFTAIALKNVDAIEPGLLARFISRDTKDYLKLLISLDLLVALAVLAYPFLWGGGDRVIDALLSFVVLRRVLRIMVRSLRSAIKLARRRPITDALFFAGQDYRQAEAPAVQTLRLLFSKQKREARAAQILQDLDIAFDRVLVDWCDSRLPGLLTLSIDVFRGGYKPIRYQQQIYLPKQGFRLDNEAVLFDHVTRERLGAPAVIARYDEGPFRCQICAVDNLHSVGAERWCSIREQLFASHVSAEPPEPLVRAYRMSHPLLADRLSDDFVRRIGIAVDTAEQARCLEALIYALPKLRERLSELPLYVCNPEIQPASVLVDADLKPVIMSWGKWRLEPIGYGLSEPLAPEALEPMFSKLRARRSDLSRDYGVVHIELARQAGAFEERINDYQFKQALALAELLLENPLINEVTAAGTGLLNAAKGP